MTLLRRNLANYYTLLATCLTCLAGAQEVPVPSECFGFLGPEVFRIESQISQLRVGDLDGDGLNDIAVVNNLRSKINLLYNQTGQTNPVQAATARREINELPSDARFRLESFPSEKRISGLVLTDLNGDQRPDMAYFGEPKELVVLYNEGTNHWSTPRRWAIEDGQLSPNGLCSGDLNGDGRDDLVLLGETSVYVLYQGSERTLEEPRKLPFSGSVKSVQVVDANGDKRGDLLLVNWEDRNPFRLRLQQATGELGPEFFFSYVPIRSYWADKLHPGGPTQVISIAQNSGRAQVSEFAQREGETLLDCFREGQFQVMPLTRTTKARRGMLWADATGHGRADLLVAEPENGQLLVYEQDAGGSLGSPTMFPTLAGVNELAVADWDGDGRAEVFLLSADERQVGVTRFDKNQRLPFPDLVPLDGRPIAMAVGKFARDAEPVLAVIIDQDGKRSLVTLTAKGETRRQKLHEKFMSSPAGIWFQDADQDGHTDLVVLVPYEKIKILRQVPGCDFEEIDVAPPGGVTDQPWLSRADVDGDGREELLLPQKHFVRAVVLATESIGAGGESNQSNRVNWSFRVKEQINGAASNSRLTAAAAIPNPNGGVPFLSLLDAERKALSICERDASLVWRIVRNLPLPQADFSEIQAIALGSTKANTVAFLGVNQAGWLPLAGMVWTLTELDGYETPIRDGHLGDVVSGDLDNDGRKDLVFLETARNHLDLVMFDARQKLVPANRWQVFEERTFRSRRDLPEPREAVVADLTGDGKNDLAVIVHDRILLYPQE